MDKNKAAVYIDIVLDKPRKLLFDMNAMATFEETTKLNFFTFTKNMTNLSAIELRAFLHAGLVHEDPSLTLKAVGAMIGPENMQQVHSSIIKSISVNNPTVEKGDEKLPLEASPQS